jgi:mannose-6-phosphate isomerase-like protein (cupin superfamily)
MESNQRHGAAHLTRITAIPSRHPEGDWRGVRRHFGLTGFGANVYRGKAAGDPIIGEHDHSEPGDARHEELYLVLTGHARFRVEGQEVDAPAGTFVAVRALDVMRSADAVADETEILVIGGEAGAAFEVADWEAERLEG